MSIRTLPFALILALVFASGAARAEIEIFFCSPSIPGGSQTADFQGCSEILAAGEKIELLPEGSDKIESKIELLPFEVRKQIDRGSPVIRMLALNQTSFDGIFSFRRSGSSPFVFLEISLQNARIVNVEMTDQEESDVPAEQLTIVPGRITWTYTAQNNDGTAGDTVEFYYDVESGQSY